MSEPTGDINIAVARALWGFDTPDWSADAWPWWATDDDGASYPRLPSFSTDIAASWQLVEKCNELGWLVAVKAMPEGVPFVADESKFMSRAVVELQWVGWMQPGRNAADSWMRRSEFAMADTVPLAICRAALAALRGGDSE